MERSDPAMNQQPPSEILPSGNDAVRAYVDLFAAAPSSRSLIANLDTRLETACVDGGWLLPVSVNDGSDGDNCYFCSPRAQYADYAAFELSCLGQPLVEIPLRGFLAGAGAIFRRASLDRVVIVNNWLLSTNLYPVEWHGEGLKSFVASMIGRYPEHAILFRSINARQNPLLLPALRRAGARLLASRVVWHYDGAHPAFMRTSDCRRDRRLLEEGPWEIVGRDDLCPGDLPNFTRLYEQLYVEKYTSLNPRYTERYFAACHALGLLRFHGLRERETGRWLGMLGIFERDGVLTAPAVGYDTAQPQKRGLYRALMALVMREAVRRGALLNLSAGAGSFKQLRGGEPCVEFTAVFDAHLPRSRRWPWKVLEELSNRVGLPMAWRKEVGR
jgi:hypothetical protein